MSGCNTIISFYEYYFIFKIKCQCAMYLISNMFMKIKLENNIFSEKVGYYTIVIKINLSFEKYKQSDREGDEF